MADENTKDKNSKKQSQIAKVQQINQTLEETKKIMEGNVDLVIERGKKIDKLKDKSSEMVKNSKKFNKDIKQYSRGLQYQKYRPWAILAGMVLGTAYALFSGFTWPLIIATAFGCGVAGFGFAWIALNVTQTLDRFKLWDAPNLSVSRKALSRADKYCADLPSLEVCVPVYQLSCYTRENRIRRREEFEPNVRGKDLRRVRSLNWR